MKDFITSKTVTLSIEDCYLTMTCSGSVHCNFDVLRRRLRRERQGNVEKSGRQMDKDGEIFHRTPGCASDPIHAIIFAPSHVGHAYGWSVRDLFFGGANLFSGKAGTTLDGPGLFPLGFLRTRGKKQLSWRELLSWEPETSTAYRRGKLIWVSEESWNTQHKKEQGQTHSGFQYSKIKSPSCIASHGDLY